MSKIEFLNDPFPDNHNGFDYTPQSVSDVERQMSDAERQKKENDLMYKLLTVL